MGFHEHPGSEAIMGSDVIISPHQGSEKVWELGQSGVLTRVDLDLAYSADKLLNLERLLIDVAVGLPFFEALALEDVDVSSDSVWKSLEFDLLSAIFDSEVRELDSFMWTVQMDIVDTHEKIALCDQPEEHFLELQEKLEDSEESLKLLQDQVAKMRMESAKFQSVIACCGQESWENEVLGFSEDSTFSPRNGKLKMQTEKQQRHILRMLEQSLARELDLENKLSMSITNEEELLMKLDNKDREVSCKEEVSETSILELLETQIIAEALMGVSNELVDRLHIAHSSLKTSAKTEHEMRSKISLLTQQLEEKDIQLEKGKSLALTSQKEQDTLHSKNIELETAIENLKTALANEESKRKSAEAKCKLLGDTNIELNQQVAYLRRDSNKPKNVDLLEKQLKQSDSQLQYAKAMVEANAEKQGVFYSALGDMGNVIEDLKAKVVKAEKRASIAETRCLLLAEANLDHNEELGFLRGKIKCLEASLQQADEAKTATASAIDMRAHAFVSLLAQLTMERERLQIQVSSLEKENKILLGMHHKVKTVSPLM